jgi:hypothetical protein
MMEGSGALGIFGGRLPVIMEGATPIAKVESLHHDVCDCNICGDSLDHNMLREVLRQSPV